VNSGHPKKAHSPPFLENRDDKGVDSGERRAVNPAGVLPYPVVGLTPELEIGLRVGRIELQPPVEKSPMTGEIITGMAGNGQAEAEQFSIRLTSPRADLRQDDDVDQR
jgi:hypothetical protein